MEYATRDQAQSAINTLSNQNLMGRLVYVREVWCPFQFVLIPFDQHKPANRRYEGEFACLAVQT